MDWLDKLAELLDRRRLICVGVATVLLAGWVVAHRWLPEGFGQRVISNESVIPVIGPVEWNAHLRFIAKEKEQYLGAIPADADAGELYTELRQCYTVFREGHAILYSETGNPQSGVDAGPSPILSIAGLREPQGDELATGAEDGSIVIWDIATDSKPKPIKNWRTGAPVISLAFGHSHPILASGSIDGAIRIWDFSGAPRELQKIPDPPRADYGLFFPDDGLLRSGGLDGIVREHRWQKSAAVVSSYPSDYGFPVYEWNTGPPWVGIVKEPVHISLSPNRQLAIVVTVNGTSQYLSVWDCGQHSFPYGLHFRQRLSGNFAEEQIEWSQDSSALCFRSEGEVCQWLNVANGRPSTQRESLTVARSILSPAPPVPPFENTRMVAERTIVDMLLGRTLIIAGNFKNYVYEFSIRYESPRFPSVPTELFILVVAIGLLAFLLRRSPYWARKHSIAPLVVTVRAFFSSAGAKTSEQGLGVLRISHLEPPLSEYEPTPAVIAPGKAGESDVDRLVDQMNSDHAENQRAVAFLLYEEGLDAAAQLRITGARLNQRFIIPMPLVMMEKVRGSPTEAHSLLNEYAERYLPGSNLFDDRNAIGDAVSFFGRGHLLAKLEQELLNLQSLGLWGLRKAGKTSILLQLEQILRKRAVVRIGLESFSAEARFGNRIFNAILRQLSAVLKHHGRQTKIPDFPVDAPARDSVADFLSSVQDLACRLNKARIPLPVVCMLDEMERVLPKDAASAEEFNVTFGALRNLCQDQRMMSLLVTDLFADSSRINEWPYPGGGTNPLFNFLKSIYAGPFEEAETLQMLDALGKLMNFPLDPAHCAMIHQLSGGHPFLARQLASMLYERQKDMDRERLLANPIRYSDTLRSYFPENVWNPLERRGEAAALALLTALAEANAWVTDADLRERCRRPDTELWSAVEWLSQTGLIERRLDDGAGESYRIAIGMFTQWFQQSEVSNRKNVQPAV